MQNSGGMAAENAPVTKRVRRPSVMLNQPYYESPRYRKVQQHWNGFKKDVQIAKKAKTKKNGKVVKVDDDDDNDVAIGKWTNVNGGNRDKDLKSKAKRKRGRPSSSSDDGANQENGGLHSSSGGESKKKKGEEGTESDEEEKKEGEEGPESDEEENSGVGGKSESENSENCLIPDEKSGSDDGLTNVGVGDQGKVKRKGKRGIELVNGRDSGGVGEGKKRVVAGESGGVTGGVRGWLDQMGLSKYASTFEIHEVDDEVLPFLTLEDLKDMGIYAVGSRRKMYRSIQKLGKGL